METLRYNWRDNEAVNRNKAFPSPPPDKESLIIFIRCKLYCNIYSILFILLISRMKFFCYTGAFSQNHYFCFYIKIIAGIALL